VGFTGSRGGGLALARVAAARAEPIPVYAEMSSINPMFVLPAALAARGEALAKGFVESLTLGVGQFCTNPGLVLGIDGPDLDRFVAQAAAALGQKSAQTMLTAGIAASYRKAVEARAQQPGVERVAEGTQSDAHCSALPLLFRTTAEQFLAQHALADEIFGPVSLVVACRDEAELLRVAEHLEGQLTATLHIDSADYAQARRLLPVLERKAGRILANGFPTGVEVSYAMVHGGPFPATSDSRTTSVGAMAIERFLRPVCYQDLPADLLPPALQDDNPLALWRLRDGELVRA
jgi:2,5-dioxopentanoate dehydrogenase